MTQKSVFKSPAARDFVKTCFEEGRIEKSGALTDQEFVNFKKGEWLSNKNVKIAQSEEEFNHFTNEVKQNNESLKMNSSNGSTASISAENNSQDTLKEMTTANEVSPPIHPQIIASIENAANTRELSLQEHALLAFSKQVSQLKKEGQKEKEIEKREEQRKIVAEVVYRQELVFSLLKFENLAQEVAKEGNKELETTIRDIIADRIITKRQMRAESYALGLTLEEVFRQATLEKNDIEKRDELWRVTAQTE